MKPDFGYLSRAEIIEQYGMAAYVIDAIIDNIKLNDAPHSELDTEYYIDMLLESIPDWTAEERKELRALYDTATIKEITQKVSDYIKE